MFEKQKIIEIIDNIKKTLEENDFNIDKALASMNHFESIKLRKEGKRFTFNEHLCGLVFSLLSNQRPWGPILANESTIKEIFFKFDKNKINSTNSILFIDKLREIKCGNRAIAKQMSTLKENVHTFEKIEKDYGSIDNYIESDSVLNIAQELAFGKKYKLKQVGIALALEYLRNVGVDTLKPDVHIRRILSNERLGFSPKYPNENETIEIMQCISNATGVGLAYLDGVLWNFCSSSSADICGDKPKCQLCELQSHCKRSCA